MNPSCFERGFVSNALIYAGFVLAGCLVTYDLYCLKTQPQQKDDVHPEDKYLERLSNHDRKRWLCEEIHRRKLGIQILTNEAFEKLKATPG